MKNNLCYSTVAQLLPVSKSSHFQQSISIKANALLITPDPNEPISSQLEKTAINNLPKPSLLKNDLIQMYAGPSFNLVRAKNDNYCYGVRDPELAAVSVFMALSKQMDLYLELGLKRPKRPLSVVVNNPFVPDNAYFDAKHFEIHIGIGTGVSRGGLTKQIAFDLGVANHEFGHAIIFLQTGRADLPGKQGAAIHEGIADILGTLVMDYLNRIWHGKRIGKPFTAQDLKDDQRIIGKYALPPYGIRTQKTKKKAPADMVGEPHSDGMIIGSAIADLLVEIASQQGTDVEKQLRLFVKIMLLALALLPDWQITFADLLDTIIIADRRICAGKHRSIIEQCFATHGITSNTIKTISLIEWALGLTN